MKIKELLKFLYSNQKIRIIDYLKNFDTGTCYKCSNKIRETLDFKVFRITTSNNELIIEVYNND